MGRSVEAIIRYDGPALAHHQMDVDDLAPSLLAFGDLCRCANEVFNGEIASVRVLVRADHEQKCFQIKLQLIQSLYESLAPLLDKETIKNANEILKLIGVVATGAVVTGAGLFGLYKWIYGDKSSPGSTNSIEAHAHGDNVIYQFVGDGSSIVVPSALHKLASDPRAFNNVRKMLGPLQNEGYNKLEFEVDGHVTQYFTKDDAKKILNSKEHSIVTKDENEQISVIRTSLKVRKAIHEGNSKWTVMYKRAVEAKFADLEWLEDYQSGRIVFLPNWRLIVDLEERVPIDDEGHQTGPASYTILKVHGVEKPGEQLRLLSP